MELDIENTDNESLRVSAVLSYCKHKILHPYLCLLSTIGLRPAWQEITEQGRCRSIFNCCYLLLLLLWIVAGYVLQGLSCFTREWGFCTSVNNSVLSFGNCKQVCSGNVYFLYVVPSILHFSAYLYAIYVFKMKENEQVQNLMERVFLSISSHADGSVHQKRLMKTFWSYIFLCATWLVLSLLFISVLVVQEKVKFLYIIESTFVLKNILEFVLITSLLWHDLVQVVLIMSYCLQARLLSLYLNFLKARLLEHSIPALDWLREIGTFQKLLQYFNEEFAPCICVLSLLNISRTISGIIWFLHLYDIDSETAAFTCAVILNMILWFFISVAPFIQAARLTTVCESTRNLGHEIRGRPFVYIDTPSNDLDTILLYTCSLDMAAKLFEIPIKGKYIYLCFTATSLILLILGQCNYIT